MNENDLAICTRGLVKDYGTTRALDGLDIEVRRGEVFGLLGPNGAGKTTTVKILATLSAPTAGEARVMGLDVLADSDAVRHRIGYVPQEATLDRYISGLENMVLFARLYGLDRPKERALEALERVGLADSAHKEPRHYSGGMKKRLDIAAGLLHEPDVLFLDEPSLGLDVAGRLEVWQRIEQLKAEGKSVLLCTNYMDEAERLCERIGIIHRGKLHVSGKPADLKAELGGDVLVLECGGGCEEAESAFRGELESSPRVARVVRGADGAVHVFVREGERAIPEVLEAARKAGAKVESLAFHRPGLDEVFLRYTGRAWKEAEEKMAASGAKA